MRRREFIVFAGTALFARPLVARAQQQPKIARLGYLSFGTAAPASKSCSESPSTENHSGGAPGAAVILPRARNFRSLTFVTVNGTSPIPGRRIVATPLQYIFGFNCFSVQLPYGSADNKAIQGAVQRWMRQGNQRVGRARHCRA